MMKWDIQIVANTFFSVISFQPFISGIIQDLHQFKQNLIQGTSYITTSKASEIPTRKVNISCQREANHNTVGKKKSPTHLADLRETHLLRGKKYYFLQCESFFSFLYFFLMMRHGYTE